QSWPADVNLLDCLRQRYARLGNGLDERIEVYYNQFERHDAVLLQRGQVGWVVPPAEDPAVNFGVEGLQPAVHHLRKARVIGNVSDGNPRILQAPSRSARANQLHSRLDEASDKLHQPRFVAHADQGVLNYWRNHRLDMRFY